MNGRPFKNNNLIFNNNLILLQPYTSATVTTTTISNISWATATGGGNVTVEGEFSVIERGVCWATSTNPTILNSHTSDGSGVGAFSSSLAGLGASTTYYVRAYATNVIETVYGSNVTFATQTLPPPCHNFTIARYSNSYFQITTSSSQFANYNGITWWYKPPGHPDYHVGYNGGSDYTVYLWEAVKATHNGIGLINGGLCTFESNTIFAP